MNQETQLGERHEPEIDTYAIGTADRLLVDYFGGTHTVHFDLQQIRENNFIRYKIEDFGVGVFFDTPTFENEEDTKERARIWVEDIDRRMKSTKLRGLILPDSIIDSFYHLDDEYEIRSAPKIE